MIYDIVIIGAGASGLTSAYRLASRMPDFRILVVEKQAIPGRKLSVAGNGKCNLTNSHFDADCYDSENKSFILEWVKKHSYEEIPAFFEELGILLYQNQGYYYPLSNQGKQVTNLLYQKSVHCGVRYAFETKVKKIHKEAEQRDGFYHISAVDAAGKPVNFKAWRVVLATGGAAFPKLGGSREGYQLASSMHLKQNPIYPVLSPVYVKDSFLHLAKGVRLDAALTLKGKDGFCRKESGQVQINENNLSGIVTMNLSSVLNKWAQKELDDCLYMDVLPDITWDNLKQFLLNRQTQNPMETITMILSGILPNPFGTYLVKRLHLDPDMTLQNVTPKQINRLTSTLKKLAFTPIPCKDYDKAQATGGGVATQEIKIDTFESKKYKNLYVIGELLDVNGKCGGYNLTFAILSGISAADHILNTYNS